MKNILNYTNILNISTNSLILILIGLILILIILVIVLIIKSNNKKSDTPFLDFDKMPSITDIDLDNIEIKSNDKNEEIAKKIELPKEEIGSRQDKFDISSTTRRMQEDINNENIDLTDFEIEQEEKSIISYKELLEKVNRDKLELNENNKINNFEIKNENIGSNKIEDNEYTFNTEVIDFDTELEKEKTKDKSEKITILNIEENNYSHDDFLKNLKTLKDNLG